MTQTTKTILIALLTSLAVTFLLINGMGLKPQIGGPAKESVYDRVMRTGSIRCGYYLYPPVMMQDPNSKEFTGLFYDLTERAAHNIGLKVEWAEEVGFGTMFAGLQAGRYDAICTPTWPDAARARVAEFGIPVFYSANYPYVRADDTRFDADLKAMNSPDIRIATVDGDSASMIAKDMFPLAKIHSLPQSTAISDTLEAVVSNHADVSFWDANGANRYMAANPGKIKQVAGLPVRVYPFSFAVQSGEIQLIRLFDIAYAELLNSGYVDQLLKKYEEFPNSFRPAALPYR